MDTTSVIDKVKAILRGSRTTKDGRCKISSTDFIAALISSFSTREGRVLSLNALRNSVIELTKVKISRGTFWERMATQKLVGLLQTILGNLMDTLCLQLGVGTDILKLLSVKKIFLIDSSSLSLPDAASEQFPAPRNNVVPAAVKIHAMYDLFGGMVKWFKITKGTTHDRKGFPPLNLLSGALAIFDLGYWDFQLLKDMIDQKISFLCRVKTNAQIRIVGVVNGVSKTCIGLNFNCKRMQAFRGKIVEILGEFKISKSGALFQCRLIGFWNTEDSQYHWYTTNLEVSSNVIYLCYRLRWQLELLWKSWKTYLHLDEINTSNKNIILSVILIGMCAGLISGAISVSALNEQSFEKQAAFSVQKWANLFIRIGRLLFEYVSKPLRGSKTKIIDMIKLFREELFDPNFNKRHSSVGQMRAELFSPA